MQLSVYNVHCVTIASYSTNLSPCYEIGGQLSRSDFAYIDYGFTALLNIPWVYDEISSARNFRQFYNVRLQRTQRHKMHAIVLQEILRSYNVWRIPKKDWAFS